MASLRAVTKNSKLVNIEHLDFAYDRFTIGIENNSLKRLMSEEEKKRTAVNHSF
jgi:ATP-dependent Zn protease